MFWYILLEIWTLLPKKYLSSQTDEYNQTCWTLNSTPTSYLAERSVKFRENGKTNPCRKEKVKRKLQTCTYTRSIERLFFMQVYVFLKGSLKLVCPGDPTRS